WFYEHPCEVRYWPWGLSLKFRKCLTQPLNFSTLGIMDHTHVVFHREFLLKYYPEDVYTKKEIEYLELKQGNLSVADYAAKFVELKNYYPHYSEETAKFLKCMKFENEMRSVIKKEIGYQRIHKFPELVNNCRIYEEDNVKFWQQILNVTVNVMTPYLTNCTHTKQ
ncbi:unnamed protein product, partial [Vicia faba]